MLKNGQKYYVHNRSPHYLFVADLPSKLCSRSAKNNFIQVYSVWKKTVLKRSARKMTVSYRSVWKLIVVKLPYLPKNNCTVYGL